MPKLHSQLCSRPPVVLFPHSLLLFPEDPTDPGKTPCFSPFCRSFKVPLSSFLSVTFQYLEIYFTRMFHWQLSVSKYIATISFHGKEKAIETKRGKSKNSIKKRPDVKTQNYCHHKTKFLDSSIKTKSLKGRQCISTRTQQSVKARKVYLH